jgi:hypothetical protein
MATTNYVNTFITVSPDTKAVAGTIPARPETIAGCLYSLLADRPYEMTSDDALFEVFRLRDNGTAADLDEARAAFFSKSHPCLRTCPLVKQFGWGIHHDENGRIALYGVESPDYRRLSKDTSLTVIAGVRSSRR